ncbi:MAG: hypothetical protein IJE60_11180 [Tyzzerella sp.]|nr:hypothetical protein [Tyzzerella sp.]
MSKQEIRQELSEFLQQYYDGSFSRMACDYIHATGMKEEEVEALLEAMRESKSMELTTKESLTHKVLTSGCRSAKSFERILDVCIFNEKTSFGEF